MLGAWTFRRDEARTARKMAENDDRFPVLKEKRRRPDNLSGVSSG